MIRRVVKKSEVEAFEATKWNACIDLVAIEEYEDLTSVQQVAHLAFVYDAEVQNGGHGQYFSNKGADRVTETIEALRVLGAVEQAELLRRAFGVLQDHGVTDATNLEQYIGEDGDRQIDELDQAYYQCDPDVATYFESYFKLHEAAFLEIQDS